MYTYLKYKGGMNRRENPLCVKRQYSQDYVITDKEKGVRSLNNIRISPKEMHDEKDYCKVVKKTIFIQDKEVAGVTRYEKKDSKIDFVVCIPDGLTAEFRFGDTKQNLAVGENRISCTL